MTNNENATGRQDKHVSATRRWSRRFLDWVAMYLLVRQLVAWFGHALMLLDPSCGGEARSLGAALVALVMAFPAPPQV